MPERRAILILGQKKAGTTALHSAIAATSLPILDLTKAEGEDDLGTGTGW